jgi:hypothetical protein
MQENIYYNSKENIRNRLFKHAVEFWGIRSTADLDPMVKLLIEALSAELYNLANDLRNTESRLLDRLARLLTPEILTSALPAHALLQAQPVEARETLSATQHFVYTSQRRGSAGEQADDLFFTPVQAVHLYNTEVVYMATGNKLFTHDARRGRVLQAVTRQGKYLPNNSLLIGLRVNHQVQALDQLSFYLECNNYLFKEEWYNLLALASCTISGRPYSLRAGLPAGTAEQDSTHTRQLLDEYETMQVITRDIRNYYDKHFLSFSGQSIHLGDLQLQHYPEEWVQLFEAKDLARLQEPLVWVQLSLPALIQQHLLDDMAVYTNVFPVVNRRLHKLKHRFKGIGNIIPIRSLLHESFLAVHEMTDSQGRLYTQVPYSHNEEQETGSYTIRMGGAERFDNRNARETIDYLFELLRDESAAFSAYGYDFLTNALKNLQQGLTLVEQKARQTLSEMTESTRYVIVKPLEQSDTIHLEYWTSQGELPNQLRTGSQLVQFESASVRPDSIRLLSRPKGGRRQAQAVHRLQAYKYSLMTRDRVITEEDIRNFCFMELGNRVEAVAVKRGVMMSPHPKEGLRKTTDLHITPSPVQPFTEEEWQHTSRQLLQKLQTRSNMHVAYRVFLDERG